MNTRTRMVPLALVAAAVVGALALGRTAGADGGKADAPAGLERGEKILRGLDQGIEALQLLGGQEEEVARLRKLRSHLAERLAHARSGAGEKPREGGGEKGGIEARGEDDEKRALSYRAELLRLARKALKEGDKHDAAELVERAIQTAELLLGGRQDAEAQAAYERTPDLANLSEVLQMAAALWEKFGHENAAATVAELARYYAQRAKQQAAARRADDDDDDDDGDDDDDEMEDEDEEGDRDERDDDDVREHAEAARHAVETARARLLVEAQAQARRAHAEAQAAAERARQAGQHANVEQQVAELRAQVAEMRKVLEALRAELEAARPPVK